MPGHGVRTEVVLICKMFVHLRFDVLYDVMDQVFSEQWKAQPIAITMLHSLVPSPGGIRNSTIPIHLERTEPSWAMGRGLQ
jgi:hypothetical protein